MPKPHIETVEIRCACDEITLAVAPGLDVDVADFLKGAIYRGWRLIDADCAQTIPHPDGGVDVLMRGVCEHCARAVAHEVHLGR
jgi:hypothetical protein